MFFSSTFKQKQTFTTVIWGLFFPSEDSILDHTDHLTSINCSFWLNQQPATISVSIKHCSSYPILSLPPKLSNLSLLHIVPVHHNVLLPVLLLLPHLSYQLFPHLLTHDSQLFHRHSPLYFVLFSGFSLTLLTQCVLAELPYGQLRERKSKLSKDLLAYQFLLSSFSAFLSAAKGFFLKISKWIVLVQPQKFDSIFAENHVINCN